MQEWYYRDAAGRSLGPVGQDTLGDLYRQGAIRPATLVWSAGEAARPIETVLAGMASQGARSPPLPGTSPASAGRSASGAALTPVVPPPGTLPTWAKASLIALGVLLVLLAPLVGIMAAITIPAYQQYVLRSQVMAADAQTALVRARLAEWMTEHGSRCPEAGWMPQDGGPDAAGNTVDTQLAYDAMLDTCTIRSRLHGIHPDVDGAVLHYQWSPHTGWQCTSTGLDAPLAPSTCPPRSSALP